MHSVSLHVHVIFRCVEKKDREKIEILCGGRLKGKGKGISGALEARSTREEGRKGTRYSPPFSLERCLRFPFSSKRMPRWLKDRRSLLSCSWTFDNKCRYFCLVKLTCALVEERWRSMYEFYFHLPSASYILVWLLSCKVYVCRQQDPWLE